MTAGERLIERGRREGLEQGLEQGRAEQKLDALKMMITLKFGAEALDSATLTRLDDATAGQVGDWYQALLTAESLEALLG